MCKGTQKQAKTNVKEDKRVSKRDKSVWEQQKGRGKIVQQLELYSENPSWFVIHSSPVLIKSRLLDVSHSLGFTETTEGVS